MREKEYWYTNFGYDPAHVWRQQKSALVLSNFFYISLSVSLCELLDKPNLEISF
jgi:hypothetical protein